MTTTDRKPRKDQNKDITKVHIGEPWSYSGNMGQGLCTGRAIQRQLNFHCSMDNGSWKLKPGRSVNAFLGILTSLRLSLSDSSAGLSHLHSLALSL